MSDRTPLLAGIAALESGDWERAHDIAQQDESPLGCWLHGIVHLVEGDLANAKYWYRRARRPWPSTPDRDGEIAALKRAAHGAADH